MELTLIATMVLSVINITGGKMSLINSSGILSPSIWPYLSKRSVCFTLPFLSQVKAKKCGMVKMKQITVAMHIYSRVLFLEHHMFDLNGYTTKINLSTQTSKVIEALPVKANI